MGRPFFSAIVGVAVGGVLVLASFYLVGVPSVAPTYPAIAVTNGSMDRNLVWNTTPAATNQTLFADFTVTSSVVLISTQAVSTFEMAASVSGDSVVTPCGCGVGLILYLFQVVVNGSVAPGLEPTSVTVVVNNFGINTDQSSGAEIQPWLENGEVNVTPFSTPGGEYGFGENGSVSASTNLLNDTGDRPTEYFFRASLPVLAEFQPLANGTVGVSTFHLSASLLGLGRTVVASMTLTIKNSYS